jgi:hypothetical protein
MPGATAVLHRSTRRRTCSGTARLRALLRGASVVGRWRPYARQLQQASELSMQAHVRPPFEAVLYLHTERGLLCTYSLQVEPAPSRHADAVATLRAVHPCRSEERQALTRSLLQDCQALTRLLLQFLALTIHDQQGSCQRLRWAAVCLAEWAANAMCMSRWCVWMLVRPCCGQST